MAIVGLLMGAAGILQQFRNIWLDSEIVVSVLGSILTISQRVSLK